MVKRAFPFFLSLLLISCLVSPCFAVDNTIGVVQETLPFIGFSVVVNDNPQFFSASDGIVRKSLTFSSDISISGDNVYFYFKWPELAPELTVYGSFGLAANLEQWSFGWYGAYSSDNTVVDMVKIAGAASLTGSVYSDGLRYYTIDDVTLSNNSSDPFDYLVCCISGSPCSLSTSLTFSEAASSSRSIYLTPSFSSSSISYYGRVGFSSIPSIYVDPSLSTSASSVSGALLNLIPASSGDHYVAKFVSSAVLSNIFGGVSGNTVSSSAVIRTSGSGSVSNSNYTGTLSSASFPAGSGPDFHVIMCFFAREMVLCCNI